MGNSMDGSVDGSVKKSVSVSRWVGGYGLLADRAGFPVCSTRPYKERQMW